MAIILPPETPNGVWTAAGGPFNQVGQPFTNPSTAGLSYIGPVTTEWITDLPVFETPFASDPKEYIYHLLYKVKASAFLAMPLYQAGPYGGIHVGESNFSTSTGGILSFSREFARKPDSRNEFETFVYAYQFATYSAIVGYSADLQTIAVSDVSITEVPVAVTSRIQYDYFDTLQPSTIPLPKAPKALVVNGVGYFIHGWGHLVNGDQILAEDATMQPWRGIGRIYERRQRFIEMRKLAEII